MGRRGDLRRLEKVAPRLALDALKTVTFHSSVLLERLCDSIEDVYSTYPQLRSYFRLRHSDHPATPACASLSSMALIPPRTLGFAPTVVWLNPRTGRNMWWSVRFQRKWTNAFPEEAPTTPIQWADDFFVEVCVPGDVLQDTIVAFQWTKLARERTAIGWFALCMAGLQCQSRDSHRLYLHRGYCRKLRTLVLRAALHK
ncbi:MAG: hypothetical protein Q9165_008057 [Trypethelium subeluteriae]